MTKILKKKIKPSDLKEKKVKKADKFSPKSAEEADEITVYEYTERIKLK